MPALGNDVLEVLRGLCDEVQLQAMSHPVEGACQNYRLKFVIKCYNLNTDMRSHEGMKPQDIVVLLKILLWRDRKWRQVDLALELGMSQSEINFALSRLVRSGLLDAAKQLPMKRAFAEFLIHGLKYVYPASLGAIGRGMATAQSHDSLAKKLIGNDEEKVVWPDPRGEVRGQALEPLYPSVPFAARRDSELYEWLALIDAVRIGPARVQKIAADRITKKLEVSS